MPTLTGGCHCGNIHLQLELTQPLDAYEPRECDCSFCRKHGAAYISDPRGKLRIDCHDAPGVYRQGDELADMLFCRTCAVLIGALLRAEGRLFAAVNFKATDGAAFGAVQSVSPQTLSAADKLQRWRRLWFADVQMSAPAQQA